MQESHSTGTRDSPLNPTSESTIIRNCDEISNYRERLVGRVHYPRALQKYSDTKILMTLQSVGSHCLMKHPHIQEGEWTSEGDGYHQICKVQKYSKLYIPLLSHLGHQGYEFLWSSMWVERISSNMCPAQPQKKKSFPLPIQKYPQYLKT